MIVRRHRFGNGTIVADNLTIKAAQAYPLSGANMVITVGQYLLPSVNGLAYNADARLTAIRRTKS